MVKNVSVDYSGNETPEKMGVVKLELDLGSVVSWSDSLHHGDAMKSLSQALIEIGETVKESPLELYGEANGIGVVKGGLDLGRIVFKPEPPEEEKF